MIFRIAVCDDNPDSIEIIEKYFDKLNISSMYYDVYFSAEELCQYKTRNKLSYDIYFLDIEMKKMNGLELAKILRTDETNALIIFLSSHPKYVFDVFEVVTFDFLVKPISFEIFQGVLQKAFSYLNMTKKIFSFNYRKKHFNIACSEIIYIDKCRRKAFLHTPNQVYTFNMTFEDILNHLDLKLFGKIRSSCIVNLEYIQEVVRDELLLKNGELLFISRDFKQSIKKQHLHFIKNNCQ